MKHKWLKVIVFAAIVGFIGGGISLYFYWQKNSPEAVLGDAVGHVVDEIGEGDVAGEGVVEIGLTIFENEFIVSAEVIAAGSEGVYIKAEQLSDQIEALVTQQSELEGHRKILADLAARIENRWIRVGQNIFGEGTPGGCISQLRNVSLSESEKNELLRLVQEEQLIVSEKKGKSDGYYYTMRLDDMNLNTTLEQNNIFKQLHQACSNELKGVEISTVELWANKKSRRFERIRMQAQQANVRMLFDIHINELSRDIPMDVILMEELQKEIQSFPVL